MRSRAPLSQVSSDARGPPWKSIARLRGRVRRRLQDYAITRLPDYPITRLPDYPITRLPDYPITRLPDYPILHSSIWASSMSMTGMSSLMGYTRLQVAHFSAVPFLTSATGVLQFGHARISSNSGSTGMVGL